MGIETEKIRTRFPIFFRAGTELRHDAVEIGFKFANFAGRENAAREVKAVFVEEVFDVVAHNYHFLCGAALPH